MVYSELIKDSVVANINISNRPILSKGYYLNLALLYARLGFYVFPVKHDKFPYKGFEWTKLATNDPNEIIKMWQVYPYGRPAFYCKPSGIVVLDTDNKPEKGKYGFRVLKELIGKLGPLPKTVLVYTQSNGTHMYYRMPKDRGFIRNYKNCIDIQTNHYCLCGGVYTPKGSYRFAKGYTFDDIKEIPELPPNWVDFLTNQKTIFHYENSERTFAYQKPEVEGDFKILYEECLLCKTAVDKAQVLKEEAWFAFASILSDLKNGWELFDKFSQPYPDYTPEKTLEKFKQGKKYKLKCSCIAKKVSICNECKYYKNKGEKNDKIK